MSEQYALADVFVLSSVCEGSATAWYEALAAGLPVITAPNAGSVVRDASEGFVVPIRDPEAITQCLLGLSRNCEAFASMSKSAVIRAAEFTVIEYGRRLREAIGSGVGKQSLAHDF